MTHSIRHSSLTADDVGSIVRWTVADAAGLAALTPALEDLGRVAWQLDTDQIFLLASLVPKWVDLSGIGAGVAVWGAITGTLANQTDLQAALDAKGSAAAVALNTTHRTSDGKNHSDVVANTSRAPLSGAGAPGVSTGNGKALGHVYVDTAADLSYSLVDATTDANKWDSATTKLAFSLGGVIMGNAGSNVWVGHEANTLWTTAVHNDQYGSGAAPAMTVIDIGTPMPYAGTITDVTLWYRPSGVNIDGDFALSKSSFTDGSSTVTNALLGSLMVAPSGRSSTNAYDLSTTFATSNTVAAGDTVNLFFRNTGVGGGSINFRCTFVLEVT